MILSVAEKLKIIAKRNGLTVGDLADRTHQTRQNLSNKFSRSNFTEKEIQSLAEALGCTAEVVFTFPDGSQL